jgi:hypothetical protein
VEIKIKWIKRKQMTHENTYRDDNIVLYFQTGFSQEHQGRYDINESNLMQHKEQQKTNSIFIKKNIFCRKNKAFKCKKK